MPHSWTTADAAAWKRLIFRAEDLLRARRQRGSWSHQTLGDLARAARSTRKACFPVHGLENHTRLMAFLTLCETVAARDGGRDALIAALDRGVGIARDVLALGEQPPPAASATGRLPYADN